MTPPDERAVKLVLTLLSGEPSPTTANIHEKVGMVVSMLQGAGESTLDADSLARHVETLCNIYVPTAGILVNPEHHVEWLAARRAEIAWRFWERYQRYLGDVELLPPKVTRKLDDVTEGILGRLEDPTRSGPWDTRGMVVGQVQSGKTANYIGLICKAADAGYRLIIVMAGIHNSLRSQTQLRMDQGFLGFDTQQRQFFDQSNTRIGVGQLLGFRLLAAHSLTNSAEKGDFRSTVARQAGMIIGGADPVLLVVKKNAAILNHLLRWATQIQQNIDPTTGRTIVRDVPLLLIDDEADNASINTKKVTDSQGDDDKDADPTKINGLIRSLLRSFEKSAYVGYTATPFANIFINERARSTEFGDDLFPRNFIYSLRPPSNYLGPATVFGLSQDPAAGIDAVRGLPVVRAVEDYEDWMPNGHSQLHEPGAMPASLRRALLSYLLAISARAARGETNVHNSMLVHVTRFNSVQQIVADQVKEELDYVRQRLVRGDGQSSHRVLDELRRLWEEDFVPTTATISQRPEFCHETGPVDWSAIADNLPLAASRVQVNLINGRARDALQYIEHPQGLSIIAVGGDKLSRGLTLEGLTVSYFLRASKMYDTLMQMGRWFGYRPGYADLCRLYMSDELADWYRDITLADEELRHLFDDMVAQGATPRQYGLRVRNHPSLAITAAAKMRAGSVIRLSYSGDISETVVFDEARSVVRNNLRATELLIQRMTSRTSPATSSGNLVWHDVPGEDVVDFLSDYSTHERNRRMRAELLREYVRRRIRLGELTTWTVCLISNRTARSTSPRTVGGYSIGLSERQRHPDARVVEGEYRIQRLVNPPDELLDLDDSQRALALAQTRAAWQRDPGHYRREEPPDQPSGSIVRRLRPAERGLLLIYPLDGGRARDDDRRGPAVGPEPVMAIAISFPESKDAESAAIEYTVNNVYWEQEFGFGA